MKIQSKLFGIAATIVLTVAIAASPATAATSGSLDVSTTTSSVKAQFVEARAFLTEYGVDQATQRQLFDRFLAGGQWDSFSSASSPVRVQESIEDGYNKAVSYYPDGSVAVSRIERPTVDSVSLLRGVSPMSSPHGCTAGSGGLRTNCQVDTWVGLISMGFRANYNLSTNRVLSVWGASWSIGGSISSSLAYLGTPNSYTGLETVTAQMILIPYSTSFNLAVTLSGGVATESWW